MVWLTAHSHATEEPVVTETVCYIKLLKEKTVLNVRNWMCAMNEKPVQHAVPRISRISHIPNSNFKNR